MDRGGVKRLGRRLAMWLVLLACLHLVLNFAVGRIVTAVFARGTGCIVHLERPQVSYFPLRAKAENVHVYHPTEGPERGFRVKDINIELNLSGLLRKKLVINELNLLGSRVITIGEDTGFINVLDFLFDKDDDPAAGRPPLLARGWDVWVKRVHITTGEAPGTNFIIGTDEFQVLFDTATFNTGDPVYSKKRPVLVDTFGTNMRVQYGDAPPLPLGRVDGVGTIHRGIATITRAVLTDDSTRLPENRTSRLEGRGYLSFGDVERYDLHIKGDMFDHYFARLMFPARDYLLELKPHLILNAHISGKLDEPQVGGDVRFGLGKGAPLMVRDSCAVRDLSASFTVSPDELSLKNIRIEDVVQKGSLDLTFDAPSPLKAELIVALDRESSFLRRCIPFGGEQAGDAASKKLEPLNLAVNEALADSKTTLELSGSLRQAEFKGSVLSEIYVNSPHAHSNLKIDFTLSPEMIDAKLRERGVVPQIENRRLRAADAVETQFTTRINSNISASVRYEFGSGMVTVEELDVERYPTDRAAARLAPFLSQKWYGYIARLFSRESLVDASGRFTLAPATLTGSGAGRLAVSDFSAGPLQVERLEMPVEFKDGSFRAPDIKITAASSVIRGSASVAEGGRLKGALSGSRIPLESAPLLADRGIRGSLDVEAGLGGTLGEPTYSAELTLRTLLDAGSGGAPLPETSTVSISGSSERVVVDGDFLEGHAELHLEYPFAGSAADVLTARLSADRFPLDFLLGGDEVGEQEGRPPASSLTGRLVYEGSRSEPLLGSGMLMVTELVIDRQGVRISHEEPLTASIDGGRMQFENVFLNLSDKTLEVRGHVDHLSGWDAKILGKWDLGALTAMVPELEQFSGLLDIDLSVAGELFDPVFKGDVRLSDGSISFPLGDSIVGAEGARALARFRGTRIDLEEFDARVGEGWVVGRGSITNFPDPYTRRVHADFLITDARLQPVDNLTVAFGGILTVEKKGVRPLVIGGDIEFTEAQYEKQVNLAELLKSITRYIIGSDVTAIRRSGSIRGEEEREVVLDVQLRARSGLLVDTNIAKADLRGAVRLHGPPQVFTLDGKIEIVDGTFNIGASEFDVITGEVVFSPHGLRLDPRLDIVAEAIVGGETGEQHNVRLSISNTMSDPRVRFSSDSGLSENEIVALFGLGSGGLTVLSQAGDDRTFRELIDPRSDVTLRERLAGLAGFSEVQISSGLSENTGEFVPSVSARRPFVGKSSLQIQSELSGEQLSEIGVDYPLTPYLSLSGGWRSRPVTGDVSDTTGSYNVGLRFRRSFSGLTLFPLKKPKVREISP